MAHDQSKQTTTVNGNNKEKTNQPLMILSGGKVVGNINAGGDQWKEVRDNRVKGDTKKP